MNRFLTLNPLKEVIEILKSIEIVNEIELVPLQESYGRILARDIYSDVDVPGFDRSTVDGFAVKSVETIGASESLPSPFNLLYRIKMGENPPSLTGLGNTIYIPTGGKLPCGSDAVVMIENTEEMGEIFVKKTVSAFENVIRRGEDFSINQPALTSGIKITSRQAGVLAACGITSVPVYKKIRVAIISTGDEIIPVSKIPEKGEIRDTNSSLSAGFVLEHGAVPDIIGIIPDSFEELTSTLNNALETSDLILLSGGSSKGELDKTAMVIETKGSVIVHGIAMAPGKPTIIGVCKKDDKNIPVIGLPGHPAAAYMVLHTLIGDLIDRMQNTKTTKRTITGRLVSAVHGTHGRDDFIRVTIKKGNNEYEVNPIFGKSGLINTLVNSDGYIVCKADNEGLETGAEVEVILW